MGSTDEVVAAAGPGHRVRRWPQAWWAVAAGYPVGLVAAGLLLAGAAPSARAQWLAWASTNVVNLARHPFGSLVVSAFVSTGDPAGFALLGLVGLAVAGRRFGAWRTVTLVFGAHTIGTVASEGIQAARLGSGAVSAAGAYLMDVGPSYVVVAALAAGLAYGRGYGRLLSAAGLGVLAPTLFDGLFDLDVTAIGHLTSIVAGLLLGWLLRPRAPGTATAPATPTPAAAVPATLAPAAPAPAAPVPD